ncbi:hypothetical protein VD659_02225 [Herbiconiux sp. 11R-BC]|uniref:hypothetical protein n=1 Tax=Herbiconiux sp. 11R-BC TaxID=3111637 RepID=UPI003BFBFD1A
MGQTTTFLEMYDGNLGARATAGSCSGISATLELTADGGSTWVPVSFGATVVRNVLSLTFVSDTQLDVVAKVGTACSPAVVTSYTSGQFWQAYPDRLAGSTYVDPSAPSSISLQGVPIASPCAQVLQLEPLGDQVVARCAEGLFLSGGGTWTHVTLDPTIAIAVDQTTGRLFGATVGGADCDGVLIRNYSPTADGAQITDTGCVSVAEPIADPAIEWVGTTAWFWNKGVLHTSTDSGATWRTIP